MDPSPTASGGDQLGMLFILCASMFLGAFGSGYVPLMFNLSENKLRLITIFGAGLLVGTALVVVIPEGISMHYEGQLKHAAAAAAAAHAHGGRLLGEALHGEGGEGSLLAGASHAHGEEEVTHAHPGHWQIGAALALGFAFQLVVDRLSGGLHAHSHGVLGGGGGGGAGGGGGGAQAEAAAAATDHSAKSKSAMAGMIVHAAVDGVALGATLREGDSALSLLVFLAIMLHKAPSSFGLASYLLHHGITPEGVKRRLLLFSSAAPLGAFCTYMLLSMSLLPYKQVCVGEGAHAAGPRRRPPPPQRDAP
jgi:zinc transporter 9